MKRTNMLGISIMLLVISLISFSCAGTQVTKNEDISVVQEDIITYLTTKEGAMPQMMDTSNVIAAVLDSHEQWDGSTVHFRWGDLSGAPLYVVSLFPDLGIIKKGKDISKEELTGFIESNYSLFEDPRVCIGTWFNGDDGNTYIDINVVMADMDKALELGKKFNQIAIFSLETFEETPTGGDGKPIENLPAPADRLPEFK